ncbi:hypothetical protein HYH03_007332 [Edaphochlamys debaryana]|uniref:2Fe-2S ferredoxin-type domain-containing protein n=1 Tax=Edaphochlamys debaryana TaxID=47281 RepID=A0A835Y269_9CHLO|nr:hypothetical protein HYH03_007332 [Edaphochlamys debaryana]|eukprot:KAG2494566.1 hypothetical protein HYH03_007332 [Edaphochlamys debaryana]
MAQSSPQLQTRPAAFPSGQAKPSHDAVNLRTITFQTKSGAVHTLKAPRGANVYNSAERSGVHLPAVCKQGSCSSCVCKLLEGTVTYSTQPECLTPKLKGEGFVAICVASVNSDATFLTHQGATLRAERAEDMDRMKHRHG